MRDWKSDLVRKHGDGKGGPMGKTCAKCGIPLKDPKFTLCFKCNNEAKTEVRAGLRPDYLEGGYFDEKGFLKERYIAKDGDADIIAKSLGEDRPNMTNHQLRRFFGHVRAADTRLRMIKNFAPVYVDLKKLEPFVSEAKGKGKIPQIFYDFTLRNLQAVKTEKDFIEGFVEHFQAVVAFFTFHYPKK